MACCGFQAFLLDDEVTAELIKQGKNYARLGMATVCVCVGGGGGGCSRDICARFNVQ